MRVYLRGDLPENCGRYLVDAEPLIRATPEKPLREDVVKIEELPYALRIVSPDGQELLYPWTTIKAVHFDPPEPKASDPVRARRQRRAQATS